MQLFHARQAAPVMQALPVRQSELKPQSGKESSISLSLSLSLFVQGSELLTVLWRGLMSTMSAHLRFVVP
jgi:hypothetical protein